MPKRYHCPVPPPPIFLVNPAAASGRTLNWWANAWPVLQREFPEASCVVLEPEMTDQLAALPPGELFVIGVGGDGTHHTLINAFRERGLLDRLTYAPLPFGSGNDWCRTLCIPRHILRWVLTIRRGRTIDHRIGEVTYGTPERKRCFINVAGLAYDAEVVRRAEALSLKRGFLYPLLTARYLAGYTAPQLELTHDHHRVSGRFHTINLGIGRYNGGGMRLVPQADPTADTLALTYAVDLPLSRILANSWRFYTDTIGRVNGVTATHATHVYVSGPTGVEADGEYLGRGPVEVRLLEQTVRVVVGS